MPSDEKLARCSRDARLTFVYLITQVDDDGLIPATPRQLLGLLYPHDESVSVADIEHWTGELVSIGAIRRRRTRDGSPVIEMTNWATHQKIKHRAKPVLLNTLAPMPKPSGGSGEDRGRVSPTNQQPATKDLGPTTDQGPTADQVGGSPVDPTDPWHARAIAAAANRGVKTRYGAQTLPYVASNGFTHQALVMLSDQQVGIEFAVQHIEDAAASCALEKRPGSLKYFAPRVIDQWRAEAAQRDAITFAAPSAIGDRDPLYFSAVRGAREGDAEWIAYCAEKHIDWKAAA